ncbi:hypothetical protein [Chryseobacterium sp. CH1]|nr:hypothetical protein [Chryseobacterium sp. CH1]RXM63196.1 hypothetical protein BOQ60_17805 [Chryseobacterium sp. CH1]
MKVIFPSNTKWGRFFFLVLLFVNFHSIYAACKPEETDTDINNNPAAATIFISKETTVSGLEYLHISQPDVKKGGSKLITAKKPKKVKKLLKKTQPKHSKVSPKPQSYYTLSSATKSDLFVYHSSSKIVYAFGSGSFNFKSIVTDELKTIDILIVLLGIFLIIFYKSRIFFNYYFSKKFQRPPPVIGSI